MNCPDCKVELAKDDRQIWCPKCGKSHDKDLVKELYKFYYGKK